MHIIGSHDKGSLFVAHAETVKTGRYAPYGIRNGDNNVAQNESYPEVIKTHDAEELEHGNTGHHGRQDNGHHKDIFYQSLSPELVTHQRQGTENAHNQGKNGCKEGYDYTDIKGIGELSAVKDIFEPSQRKPRRGEPHLIRRAEGNPDDNDKGDKKESIDDHIACDQ